MKPRPSSEPQPRATEVICRPDAYRPRGKVADAVKALTALTLAAALLGTHAAASAQPSADMQRRLGMAMDSYERCQWGAAFEQLSALADGGHAESARIALLMARFGPTMYGSRFDTDAQQRERWLTLAILLPQQIAQRTEN